MILLRRTALRGPGGALLALVVGSVVLAGAIPVRGQEGRSAELVEASAPGWQRFDAVVPGRLLAALAVPASTADPGGLFLLAAPEAGGADDDPDGAPGLPAGAEPAPGPRSLYRLSLSPAAEGGVEAALTLLRDDLHPHAEGLEVADLDGDGRRELLVGRVGAVEALRRSADGRWTGPETLLEHPAIGYGFLPSGRLRASGGIARLAVAEPGRLELYDLTTGPPPAGPRRVASWRLPLQAELEDSGLRLVSPSVRPFGGDAASATWAVGPEPIGRARLRTLLLSPAASGEAAPVEAWSRLPAARVVAQSRIVEIDGRPCLLAILRAGQGGSFLGKLELAVWSLAPERTRAGRRPLFETETKSRQWFRLGIELFDHDGDGRDDLVLIQPEGLGGGDLVVERFAGLGGGRFLARSAKTALKNLSGYADLSADHDGDGVRDLVVATRTELLLFPGAPGSRRPVAKDPARRVLLPGVEGPRAATVTVGGDDSGSDGDAGPSPAAFEGSEDLAVADLDGDGRPEVLLYAERAGAVRVVRWSD